MDTGLKGKNALITGGSTGIGFGIAKALAAEGVNLAVASRNPVDEAIEELKNKGVDAFSIKADVSEEKQVVNMVKTAIGKFGHLDLYINNSAWTWHEPITKLTTEAWMNTINTNLSACVWACREVSRHMIKRKQGSLLIVGSTAAFHPLWKETSYRCSKVGLKAFMEVLSLELVLYGIRVNMIIPGGFVTRLTTQNNFFVSDTAKKIVHQTPMHRFGEPDECGPSAVLLLSDKLSSYTTGSVLVIDGGVSLSPFDIYADEEILKMNAVE